MLAENAEILEKIDGILYRLDTRRKPSDLDQERILIKLNDSNNPDTVLDSNGRRLLGNIRKRFSSITSKLSLKDLVKFKS